MESNDFDWPGAHFLTTGSPHDPGSNFQLPAHDDGPIGPWDQLASMTGMQGDEMDWNFYDRPRQPSNPNQFPTGPPAEPAHHRAGIIHGGASGYLNHQAAGVTNGLPTPPTYGATSSTSLYFGEPAHAQSSAYVEPALTGQAGAMGGFDKREVAYGGIDPPQQKSKRKAAHLSDDNWTYAVEVWPAADFDYNDRNVVQHVYRLQQVLEKKSIDYDLSITAPVEDCNDICRRYTLPRRFRDNYRVRLEFLQVFSTNRGYNQALPHYRFKMSVVYETRSYLPSDPYPPNLGASDHGDDGDAASSRYSPNSMQDLVHFNQLRDDPTLVPPSPESPHHLHHLLAPPTPPEGLGSLHHHNRLESEGPAPPRIKPISKPDRVVLKNIDGKYCCTWPNCTDEVREFNRKCEWSKHMDKHDRPYKCPAGGCEKLPGFTYSGGLLRHEREVHGKHGGPKNPLNCPHVNCKRHTGKGFSRLENLNEHLRRVHTADIPTSNNTEEADDVAVLPTSPKIGEKRKPDDDLREEVKRLQGENQELRSQVEAQKRQQIAMMQLMQELQESLQNISGHPERIHQPRFESGSPPAAPAAPAASATDNGASQVSQSF